MTCLYSKVKIEVTTVLDNYFSIFNLVYKNIAKINLTLLVALYRIRLTTKEY
jgi:hypothetical protein